MADIGNIGHHCLPLSAMGNHSVASTFIPLAIAEETLVPNHNLQNISANASVTNANLPIESASALDDNEYPRLRKNVEWPNSNSRHRCGP